MKEKRSMSQALNMTPEKMEFIRGGSAAVDAEDVAILSKPKLIELTTTKSDNIRSSPETLEDADPPKISRPIAPTSVTHGERPSMLGEVLVPLTTRLRPETADALRRANLEQRLKRAIPATQQEIVEEAVAGWLRANAYLC